MIYYGVCGTLSLLLQNPMQTVCANTFEPAYNVYTVYWKTKLHAAENTHVNCLNTLCIALSNNNMAST